MLAMLPVSLAAQTSRSRSKAKQLPAVGEFVRFSDPTTETFVVRLTSLKSASFLPAAANRFVSIKDRFLLFSSDRNGDLAPFQVDLRSGVVRQLATTTHLASESLCLDPKEHWLYFLDGGRLLRIEMGKRDSKHPETLADGVSGYSIAQNGDVFLVRAGNLQRLAAEGGGMTLADGVGKLCLAQPGAGKGCLFMRENTPADREFWHAPGSASAKPLLLARGNVSDPFWEPDGKSILFLRDVAKPEVTLAEIHEVALDGKAEHCVTPTSQFASFAANFDASVFVGASRSKAQPNVVLLLRSAKRELTLCQHHASNAARVSPVFSPDARRVYFQSDEDGKPAIYSINVELLVEPPGENIEG